MDAWSASEKVRARFAGGGTEPSSSGVECSLAGEVREVEAPIDSKDGTDATGVGSRDRFVFSRPLGAASSVMVKSLLGVGALSAILTSSSS